MEGACNRYNCGYIHPNKIGNRGQRTQQNILPQNLNQNQGFQMYQNKESFLENWPIPAEASMSIHQTIARLMETIKKVDVRMENIEMNRRNGWIY